MKRSCFINIRLLVILLAVFAEVESLDSASIEAPEKVKVGSDIQLECVYKSDGPLYTIKWYKDDGEFQRFIPSDVPKFQFFEIRGITINHHLMKNNPASFNMVYLKNVSNETSGTYTCEVVEDAPWFRTAQARKTITVLPDEVESSDIVTIEAPEKVKEGSDIQLACIYKSEGLLNPMLRWYKDDREFQKVIFARKPYFLFFKTPGITINHQLMKNNPSSNMVYLTNVSNETSGVFTCEVSSLLRDDQASKTITVLPDEEMDSLETEVPETASPIDGTVVAGTAAPSVSSVETGPKMDKLIKIQEEILQELKSLREMQEQRLKLETQQVEALNQNNELLGKLLDKYLKAPDDA